MITYWDWPRRRSEDDMPAKTCTWTEAEDGEFNTGCGEMHHFSEGGPEDVGFEFCPFCGKSLKQQLRIAKPAEEDDTAP
jgi:hypothetical protein